MSQHVEIGDISIPDSVPGGARFEIPVGLINNAGVAEDVVLRGGLQDTFLTVPPKGSKVGRVPVQTPVFGTREYTIEVEDESSGNILDSAEFDIDIGQAPSAANPPPSGQPSLNEIPPGGWQLVGPEEDVGTVEGEGETALTAVVAGRAPESVPEGEDYALNIAVGNAGQAPGEVRVTSNIVDKDEEIISRTKTVPAQETVTWTLNYTMADAPQEYVTTVTDMTFNRGITFRGTTEVAAPPSPNLQFADVRFPTEAPQGATFSPAIAVANRGDADGSATVRVDDLYSEQVSLEPRQGRVLRPDITADEAGSLTYTVELVRDGTVLDSTQATVTVNPDDMPSPGGTEPDSPPSSPPLEDQRPPPNFEGPLPGPEPEADDGPTAPIPGFRGGGANRLFGGGQQGGDDTLETLLPVLLSQQRRPPAPPQDDDDEVLAAVLPFLLDQPDDEEPQRPPLNPLNPFFPLQALSRAVTTGEDVL